MNDFHILSEERKKQRARKQKSVVEGEREDQRQDGEVELQDIREWEGISDGGDDLF